MSKSSKSKNKAPKKSVKKKSPESAAPDKPFTIVGIGASAGGLQAY